MSKSELLFLSAGFLLGGLSGSAWGVDKQGLPPKVSSTSIKVEKLSQEECTTLGGTVMKYSVCGSGSACETTDEKGKVHRVCLSKK